MAYDHAVIYFPSYPLKQISMSAQAIPVRTTGPAQTEWTHSTAAAHQDLMARNVKQVTVTDDMANLKSSCKL